MLNFPLRSLDKKKKKQKKKQRKSNYIVLLRQKLGRARQI